MRIKWLGHAAFKIEVDGIEVVFDPYDDGYVTGLKNIRETANFVFCSHEHQDHNAAHLVKIEEKAPNFKLTVIDTFHDDEGGTQRGPNKIHILEFDNKIKVCHMGDIGCELEESQYELLKNIDVLMMPVGGFFTVAPELASSIVNKISPEIVIPMHYKKLGENGFGYDVIASVDDFLALQTSKITNLNTSTINYEKNQDLKGVVVLEPELL